MAADQPETDLIEEVEEINSSLDSKSKGLPSSGSFRGLSIYKVPKRLRKLNEDAYTPKLVSIGPIHHGQTHLNSMEGYKLEYCKKFLDITLVSSKEVIKHAIQCEAAVRSEYQDTVEFSRKEFVEMIVLDGLFIIMLFLKGKFPQTFDSNDEIFVDNWMLRELFHDMMLLENQLPSFFLDDLLKMVPKELRGKITFSELTRHYFMNVGNAYRVAIDGPKRHLVEYLQTFHLMMPKEDLVRYFQTFHRMPPIGLDREVYRKKKFEYTRSATELHAAGIQFKSSPDTCILKIEFTESGELIIPQLKVNEWTETLFRNLIAFEQCDHQPEYVSSYIIFFDCLINTPMDVDLLVDCNIIENSLGDSERVSDLFNNLYKETFTEYSVFYYTYICGKLNAYNKDYWHQWRAARYRWNVILKRDYFSNPWSGISVFAAIILLILTVVQTVCSIMGL